jgi:hypothetical protein
MSKRGIRLSESAATLVRESESVVGDAALTEKKALQYVCALNEATHFMYPVSKIVNSKIIPTSEKRT